MEIYDPTIEELKEAVKDITINSSEHKSGIFIGLNKDNSLKFGIWGTPRQLACLFLEIQDKLPKGVVEYANMIRESAQDDTQSNGLETQAPANNRLN